MEFNGSRDFDSMLHFLVSQLEYFGDEYLLSREESEIHNDWRSCRNDQVSTWFVLVLFILVPDVVIFPVECFSFVQEKSNSCFLLGACDNNSWLTRPHVLSSARRCPSRWNKWSAEDSLCWSQNDNGIPTVEQLLTSIRSVDEKNTSVYQIDSICAARRAHLQTALGQWKSMSRCPCQWDDLPNWIWTQLSEMTHFMGTSQICIESLLSRVMSP